MTRLVLVPGVLALLPGYAGQEDPVADLRAACLEAVGWLTTSVEVVAGEQGARVAEHLLGQATDRAGDATSYLVVGNGSATRSEKAPGHLDPRAAGFDAALGAALVDGDGAALVALDQGLALELWADTAALPRLGELLGAGGRAQVDYDDDPFGVQYWVLRWEL